MSNIDITYPTTRTEDCTETIMGLEFPDPYRWLESETEEVRQWQGAQNRLADDYVQSWPHYEALKESVSQHLTGRPALPIYAGEQWFRVGSIRWQDWCHCGERALWGRPPGLRYR